MDYLDVYYVTHIAWVVIGYAQMVVCWTTNNTRTISRLNRNTNKGDKGTQVTKTQIVTNNSKYRTREVNIAYESRLPK